MHSPFLTDLFNRVLLNVYSLAGILGLTAVNNTNSVYINLSSLLIVYYPFLHVVKRAKDDLFIFFIYNACKCRGSKA